MTRGMATYDWPTTLFRVVLDFPDRQQIHGPYRLRESAEIDLTRLVNSHTRSGESVTGRIQHCHMRWDQA